MDEVLLESLTLKFSDLFKNIASLQEKRETVLDENEHLRQLVQEEQDQLEMSCGESSEDEATFRDIEDKCRVLMERKRESDLHVKEENNLKSQLVISKITKIAKNKSNAIKSEKSIISKCNGSQQIIQSQLENLYNMRAIVNKNKKFR